MNLRVFYLTRRGISDGYCIRPLPPKPIKAESARFSLKRSGRFLLLVCYFCLRLQLGVQLKRRYGRADRA